MEADLVEATEKPLSAELGLALTASLALAACGGSESDPSRPALVPVPNPLTDIEASRFLAQAGFGGKYEDIDRLKSMGYEGWLAQQINEAPAPSRWAYGMQLKEQ